MPPTNMNAGSSALLGLIASDAMIFVFAFFICTYAAWWALAALKWDVMVIKPLSGRSALLRVMFAMTIGFFLALVITVYAAAWQVFRNLM